MGCGKTAVAFLAIMAAAGSGYQAAIMLPTEILAAQTHAKLQALLQRMPDDMQPAAAILTGSTRAKERREVCTNPHMRLPWLGPGSDKHSGFLTLISSFQHVPGMHSEHREVLLGACWSDLRRSTTHTPSACGSLG